ncbi:glutathione S-transferase family protein [Thalassotalea aquiviva]|uniref:glutathione S-transferase family protein n=1 Tax=Thalassotalea aquiviva TaxID=3242415 RepID=UPI00352A7212
MILYGDSKSGNCYKLQLVCSNLGQAYTWREMDITQGDTRTPEFLALNPQGKIPLLQREDGSILTESNAIINYLAKDSELVPKDPWLFAQVLRWQFFEQYYHEPNIAVARYIKLYLDSPQDRQQELKQKQQQSYHALDVMEQHLADKTFLVNEQYTVADISLYAYTHVAYEGGVDIKNYPAIKAWLSRVEQQPNYCPLCY